MEHLTYRRGKQLRTTIYESFKGVDFSKDELVVDKNHSPDAKNMISDEGGYPCTRQGYRRLRKYVGKINGIFGYVSLKTGERHLIVHEGSNIRKILDINDTSKDVVLKEGVSDSPSISFYMKGNLYILTGREYLFYDGKEVKEVIGKVPLVAVGRTPKGGGGTVISNINLLSSKWKEGFRGDGREKEYTLLYKDLADDKVIVTITKDGKKETKTEGETNCGFTVDRANGKITFSVAPPAPTVTGEDNVEIEAGKKDASKKVGDKEEEEEEKKDEIPSKEKILKSKSVAIYNNTVFLAGSVKGTDFRSGMGDPTYFPDTGYDEVGINSTDIMGYITLGRFLVIIKEQNGQDPSIFLRHDSTLNDQTIYVKEPSISGVGAISRRCFGSLRGDPLFLTREGVVAITSNMLTNERICQNRSYYVDTKLVREKNLETASAIEFKGRFYVFVNSNVYILDAQQDKKYEKNSGSYVYECFFWDHVPAVSVFADSDNLYFGTADGRICTFTQHSYNEKGEVIFSPTEYLDDGEPFISRWSTCLDSDGDYSRDKTVPVNSLSITLKPYLKSKVTVKFKPNNKGEDAASSIVLLVNAFTFSALTFSELSFKSKAEFSVPNKIFPAAKRYNALKIILESNSNKPFGVFNIIKRFFFLEH